MGLPRWIRSHRALTAFAAGALLTLVALAAVAWFVLSDQRRSARVLAAALSRALAREVEIERVTELGPERVVMRGVRLPHAGGWPAEMRAEAVEAAGPLLSAARGDVAPLRLTVTRPRVEMAPGGGPGAGLGALEAVRQGLRGFLASAMVLDITLVGGVAEGVGGPTEFDLVVRKGQGPATAELTLRGARGAALVLTAEARMDGEVTHLSASGHGALAPLAAWLGSGPVSESFAVGQLDLAVTAELRPGDELRGLGRIVLADAVAVTGGITFRDRALELQLSQAALDLGVLARVAGLAWEPSGRLELGDATATWPADAGGLPAVRAAVRIPKVDLPAAGIGTDVTIEQLEGRLALEPRTSEAVVHGEARAARLVAAGLDAAPVQARYRVRVDASGALARADVEILSARIEGAALQGSVGYDGRSRRLDARLRGRDAVEAAALARRLAPGWLGPSDRLELAGLDVTVAGLEADTLGAGRATVALSGLRLTREDGELATGATTFRAGLQADTVELTLEARGVMGALPVLRGEIPDLKGRVDLSRRAAGGFTLGRGDVTVRDAEGAELFAAGLAPTAATRLVLSIRAPALERLGGLWPEVDRRVKGSLTLDVELAGPGFTAAVGRLGLRVPEAALWGDRINLRDLVADVPIRRGSGMPGEPPWGSVEIAELIGYGVVAYDITSPVRVVEDRLSLNDLTYGLYAGEGKGWAEVELEAAGPHVRGQLTGHGVRIEQFIGAYGIRGGTMTGLLDYGVDVQYRGGRMGVKGRFEIPKGGTVNIELLQRLLSYAEADPTGVLRSALGNLEAFDYKSAGADVRTSEDDIRVSLSLRGRERWGIFPPRVKEINVRNLPVSFLARQFPGR